MKHKYFKSFLISLFSFFAFGYIQLNAQVNFSQSELDFDGNGSALVTTSLMFGPDGRLYFAEYAGTIKALTIDRVGEGDFKVVNTEVISGIDGIQNHNDDGTEDPSTLRETTGITLAGTAANPIIYVTSSDFRIGGGVGGGAGDTGLDTNSGIITRFTWNGTTWDIVDIVRGLPRSEENHATNGLEFVTVGGVDYLIVAQGGNTNAGSPSINFNYATEYALSGAILSINLNQLESLPILNDEGRSYIYDIPTLDDPTRANTNGITDPNTPGYNGIDVNDPFGGNDGLNQAMLVPGGPVQIFSPGFRNAYDLVVTESGAVYVTDNGANGGWGGFPENEGMTGNVTNNYVPGEPGSATPIGGEQINNEDHLHLITTDIQNYVFGSYYGGHPNPVRANPSGAGLYTTPSPTTNADAVFRTLIYDPNGSTPGSTSNASIALPANWPPVPTANIVEGDWRGPGLPNPDGPVDDIITIWGTNTNGIDEYTANNFSGAMQGDLLAGTDNSLLRRVELNANGSLENLTPSFASNLGGNALGVTCNSDSDPFPGTIWVGIFSGSGGNANTVSKILVLEPADLVNCIEPSDPAYDANADYDSDGYSNQDEVDNGSDPCNGGSQPEDFDKSAGAPFISDLNDLDDDNDNIPDALDPFQLGDPLNNGSDAFTIPLINELFSDTSLGGYRGLGFTGLMNNGDPNPNWQNWLDRDDDPNDPNPNDILGGAIGGVTINWTSGTAFGTINNQEKGFQYGIQVDQNTSIFTVAANMANFDDPLQLYGNTAAPNGELGIFIGDGSQSNYIKMVLTNDGITVLQEINDVPQTPLNLAIPVGNRPDSAVLYFEVNPASGEVICEYAFDGSTSRTTVGTINAVGNILTALQQASTNLAVGLIGSSNATGVEVQGTWDFLNVLDSNPYLISDIPDIDRYINSNDEIIQLDNFFDDDNGTVNLIYTVENNTDTRVSAVINGNDLTLSYPGISAVSSITIRATDNDLNFAEQTFEVNVTDSPFVFYRVNTGGPEITAIDGDIDWETDTIGSNSAYLANAGSNQTFTFDANSGPGVPNTTPNDIFKTERADSAPGAPNMTYSFPVSQTGNYEVRLYMGNGWEGTSEAGERLFDVQIEGLTYPTLDDIDLTGTYGHEVGTVISHIVPVTDGVIDIVFLHGAIENPMINGIEILDASDSDTPIYVADIDEQRAPTGEQLDGSLVVSAFGGDGNKNYSAVGLPSGLVIEPTNGQIGGTIAIGAEINSPYNVTITVDDNDGLTNDAVTISFDWIVFDAFSYRVNVGGNLITATDGATDWKFNNTNGPYNSPMYSVNTGFSINASLPFDKRDASIPAYIDEMTFNSIFGRERYDVASGPEMEFKFPLENGEYLVNLYLGNSFEPANEVGDRIFDISLEGVVVKDDLDLIAEFGHLVAGMLSFPVTLNDGELNILFLHGIAENPIVSGIEILEVNPSNPDLTISAIANQSNDIDDVVDFMASANGGDPSEDLTFYISGQPDGIEINPNTGQISGTIGATASNGGANNNGTHQVVVTVVKPNSAPASTVFTWTIASTWANKDENENYTARHENSFVQAGDKFYLMGGRENSRTIDIYDYASDTWTSLVDSAPFEFNHFQATEYQGLIWVIGSFKDNAFPTETPAEYVWAFDPANEEWIQGPEIPVNRRRGSAGLVMYNNKFYIIAGNTLGHNGGYVSYFDEFDPATGVWTTLADAPRERDHFAAVVIADKLYVSGGRLSGGPGGTFAPTIPEVDVYDFSNGSWTTLPVGQNLPTPRGGSSAVNFNDKLMVIGGETEIAGPSLTTVEEYNPVSQSWTALPGLNSPRHGTQAIVSGNGIFIIAGSPVRGGGNQKNMEFYGEDAPVGTPSVASELNSLAGLLIADGDTESIDLSVENGNVGVVVTSIGISGPNASDFSLVSGELTNQLLNPNTTHPIAVFLSGTGANRSAVLTINYGNNTSKEISLSNAVDVPQATNPGTQNNNEGDSVSLQIEATGSCTDVTYSASNLPAGLTIDENTGLITGTVSNGGNGSGAYQESNGLVVIEMENLNYGSNWSEQTSETGFTGSGYLFNSVDSFNTPGNGTITTQVEITSPGLYRFQWYNKIGIIAPSVPTTEHNDAWLRFNDADDFYGAKNTDGSGSIVYPKGLGKTPVVEGASSNGWLKVYTNTIAWSWSTKTSDNDAHFVFVEFDNPGTYTMEIASRSDGHLIDRATLAKVDQNYTTTQLLAAPESSQGGGSNGAADGSPYNVEITVADNCVPSQSTVLEFIWNIGEAGNQVPVAVIEADVTSGEAPLTVNFTGSNSTDDTGITAYLWDFNDGSPTESIADPTHVFNTAGVYEVALTVSDGVLSNSNTLTITVTAPPNEAPMVTNPGVQNAVEGEVVSLPIIATDSNDDVLTYSATGLPNGLSIDMTTGLISGTITAGASANSPYAVDVTVTDDGSPSVSSTVSFVWNVTDVVVNLAPVVTNPGEQNGVEGDIVSLQIGATDPDGDGMSFAAANLPNGLSIDMTTGLISGTITAGASTNSPYAVDVTVTDDGSPSESSTVSFVWNVTDVAVNLAPVVTNPGEQNGVEGDIVSLQIGATDPEGDGMSFAAANLPDGLSINMATGLISGTITAGASANSPYAVEVTVTDDGSPSESSMVSFVWNVTDVAVNLAPVVTNPGEQNGVEGDIVSLQIGATDPDGDGMSFAAANLPDGLSIDMATGLISGTITAGASANSPYAVEVTVTDDGSPSESSMVSFVWNVTDTVVNMAPVAVATADVDSGPSPLTVNFTGSNSMDDSGIVSYLWDFGTGEVSTLENPTYTFENQGIFEVTLTVVDEGGLEDTTAITIEVDDNIPLENPDGNSILIAPNPAVNSTEVWVDLIDNSEVLGMYIYDSSGRLVQNYNLMGINSNNGSYSVNTSNLHNGLYSVYVFISGETKPLVSKLLVQR